MGGLLLLKLFAVTCGVGTPVAWLLHLAERKRNQGRALFGDVAKSLGVGFYSGANVFDIGEINGTVGRLIISVAHQRSADADVVVFSVSAPGIPFDIVIRRGRTNIFLDPPVKTGDRAFDLIADARGSEASVLAVLRSDARKMLLELFEQYNGAVENGTLRVTLPRGAACNRPTLDTLTRSLMRTASALMLEKETTLEQLIANIKVEPDANVALKMMELVYRDHPSFGASASRAGLEHQSLEVQAVAAEHLGPEGADAMRAILTNEAAAVRLRKTAMLHLAAHGQKGELGPFVSAFLLTAPTDLRLAALEIAGKSRGDSHAETIASRVLECLHDPHPQVFVAAARATTRLGDARAVPLLIARLSSDDDDMVLAAIDGLSDLGAREAIAALLDLTKGVFRRSNVKKAADHALLRIRRRLGPSEVGRLSVVEDLDQVGAISMAGGGELAIAEKEPSKR